MSEGVELQVAGHTVVVTSPDKVFFQTRGDTKLDLIEYYLSVGDAVMRQMHDRPVLLQRFPNGAHGSNFFQKRIPEGAPEWLQTTTVLTPNGTPSRALVIADMAHMVWAVNLGCLGFHSWPVRASNQDMCDQLFLSMPTVKTHIGNLMAKTHSRDRVQLALYALRAGIATLY